ncbi:MAG: caspase family protein [Acidobacteriota bacterium]|nr:caspase family protein [Acidobacteriota bacterium]
MATIKRLVIILFIYALSAPLSAQRLERGQRQSWNPSRTWVFAVGILEFEHGDSWDSFPKEGRKDAELVDFFRQSGVPRDQILFIKDREATKDRIERALTRFLSKAGEGDMLIFYYTGHGAEDDASGKIYFASYDASDDLARTAWSVSSIFDTVERNFRGSRALLLADCCYSGALADEALRRRSSVSYAVLTSARSDSLSTAEWTFTDALLRGLRGNSKIDQNRDGEIELSELARYEKSRMWSKEEQVAVFKTTGDFSPEMIMVDVAGRDVAARSASRIKERVEVEWEGNWYPATILEVRGAKYRIHYLGYGSEWDEWVDDSRLRSTSKVAPADRRLNQYEASHG